MIDIDKYREYSIYFFNEKKGKRSSIIAYRFDDSTYQCVLYISGSPKDDINVSIGTWNKCLYMFQSDEGIRNFYKGRWDMTKIDGMSNQEIKRLMFMAKL